ncbi:nucleotidyl cyclase domain-containing protein [Oecophyllibacter saccharovorans]|uniref:GGDEF domain-containing protein n=1 Tax=Oecophyllibacter saccharovorans TaxID=2558360 RepID=A0A506UQA4_9PROT|nr:hypothetical protein [Oecophyllibacter saccharovorans]TPW35452.1 hypothetical protein E3202_00190 [Oecophyllibacter saccharovorans]
MQATTRTAVSASDASLTNLVALLRQGGLPAQGLRLACRRVHRLLGCQGMVLEARTSHAPGDTTFSLQPFSQPEAQTHCPPQYLTACAAQLENASGEQQLAFSQKSGAETDCLLLTVQPLSANRQLALLLWRHDPWTEAEKNLLRQFWQIAATLFEVEDRYRASLYAGRHDPETGLLTWEGMKEEITHRLSRLDANHQPGTLLRLQVNLPPELQNPTRPLAERVREERRWLGDVVSALRKAFRPTDPIGRLGSSQFVLWMDGADRFAAAERAARLTEGGFPHKDGPPDSLQIGLACREAGCTETLENHLEQATLALRQTSPGLGSAWKFSPLPA